MLARRRAGIILDLVSTQFCTAVDCRSHLNLPTPYSGNAFYAIKTSLPIPQLAPAPATDGIDIVAALELQNAAYNIRKMIKGVVAFAEYTEELVTGLSVWDDVMVGSLLLISYFCFEMHELDFGNALGGKIEGVRLPSGGLLPGMSLVLPRLPDGSCEFMVNEEEEVMKSFREDDWFRKLASEQC